MDVTNLAPNQLEFEVFPPNINFIAFVEEIEEWASLDIEVREGKSYFLLKKRFSHLLYMIWKEKEIMKIMHSASFN